MDVIINAMSQGLDMAKEASWELFVNTILPTPAFWFIVVLCFISLFVKKPKH